MEANPAIGVSRFYELASFFVISGRLSCRNLAELYSLHSGTNGIIIKTEHMFGEAKVR